MISHSLNSEDELKKIQTIHEANYYFVHRVLPTEEEKLKLQLDKESSLHAKEIAALNAQIEELKKNIKTKQQFLNETLLEEAQQGQVDGVQAALTLGANIDAVYEAASPYAKNFLVKTKLFNAAEAGNIEDLKHVIEKMNNMRKTIHFESLDLINQQGEEDGDTALHKAVRGKHKMAVQLLLEAGADPTIYNTKPYEMYTKHHANAFDIARSQDKELVSIMATPFLHCAARKGSTTLIASALASGANLAGVNLQGQTALHQAIPSGDKEVIKLLLKEHVKTRIDIDTKNVIGQTPSDLAIQSNIKIPTQHGEKNMGLYIERKYGKYKGQTKAHGNPSTSEPKQSINTSLWANKM
jgi:ankyrin repeat protein